MTLAQLRDHILTEREHRDAKIRDLIRALDRNPHRPTGDVARHYTVDEITKHTYFADALDWVLDQMDKREIP